MMNLSFLAQHAILFPKLFYCCYRQHHNHANHSELSDGEVYKLPQDEIQTPKKVANYDYKTMLQLLQQQVQLANQRRSCVYVAMSMNLMILQIAKVRRNRRKTLHKFVQDVHTAEETPAYVPGKVLYIRERKPRRRIRRRYV